MTVSTPTTARTLAHPPELVGQQIGAYHIVEAIGEGAMGTVYRAIQAPAGRAVAFKVIRADPARTQSEQQRLDARFEREVRATARLRHPHTVPFVDSGHLPSGRPFIVMELLDGETLREHLAAGGVLSPERVAQLGIQLCGALSEAHAAGIVHRDLKPSNIFLTHYDGTGDFARVMDFGIAAMSGPLIPECDTAQGAAALTDSGQLVGTPAYMSPEQVCGDPVDARSDLYALGLVLYECLTGRAPFAGTHAMASAVARLTGTPEPLPSLGLPPAEQRSWQTLMDTLLSRAPAARPPNAAAVTAQLSRLTRANLPGHPPDAPRPPGVARAVGVGALVLVVAAVIGAFFARDAAPPRAAAPETPATAPHAPAPVPYAAEAGQAQPRRGLAPQARTIERRSAAAPSPLGRATLAAAPATRRAVRSARRPQPALTPKPSAPKPSAPKPSVPKPSAPETRPPSRAAPGLPALNLDKARVRGRP